MVLLEPQIYVFTTVFLKLSFTLEPLQTSQLLTALCYTIINYAVLHNYSRQQIV
jgi:hypothetical protein